MANPPNTDNLAVGKGVLWVAEFASGVPGSYSKMGNCPSVEFEPTLERLPHYNSMAGFRERDKNPIIQMEYVLTIVCDEMAATNLRKYLMGTLNEGMQIYGMQDAEKEYALRFVSNNPVGPNQTWDFWKVTLQPNGAIALIGEDWMSMSYQAQGLYDSTNHPESPYYTVDYEDGYTETSESESSRSSESSSSTSV